MTFILPSQESKRWSQPNNSDRFGSLSMTRNIDFDKEGYLTLSKRIRALFNADDDAQMGEIVGFAYDITTDRHYVLTDDKIFYIDNVLQTLTEDTNTNVPTTLNDRSDIVAFNDAVYVSAGITDGLRRWTGSAWSTELHSLTANDAPMAVFENQNALAIGQDNTVLLLNTSHSLLETLTIPSDYIVTSIAYSNNRLFITTRHKRDGEALMFVWDGNTSAANNAFPLGAVRADCVKAYQGTVVVFTGIGQLLAFDGGGFTPLANLPLYYDNKQFSPQGNTVDGPTSHRGMVVDGDVIYLNINTKLRVSDDDDLQPILLNDVPGGVWCFDPNVGLYHRHAPGAGKRAQTNAVTTGNVNTSTEVITVAGATVPATGTPVLYDDGSNGVGTAIGGLTHRRKYYVINESSTTMKLATTKANADADTAIDLTGTGNNAQYFVFLTNQDFGNDRHTESTAIGLINIPDAVPSDGKFLLMGNTVAIADVTTTKHTIGTVADLQENRGVFVIARLESNTTDLFNAIGIKFNGIKNAEDKIILKFRTSIRDDEHKYLDTARTQTGTWSDENTFTTTADLSDVNAGDEVTVHFGAGAGYTAHISSISEAGGTYTVNIDEDVQNISSNDTMLYTIDTWQKLFTVSTDDVNTVNNDNGTYTSTGGYKEHVLGSRAVRMMQLKVELRGEDVQVEDILVNNQPFTRYIA